MNFKKKFAYLFYGLYLNVREKDKKVALLAITFTSLCQIGGLLAIDLALLLLPITSNAKSVFWNYTGGVLIVIFIGISYFLLVLNGGAQSIIDRYDVDRSINNDNAKKTAEFFLNITSVIAMVALGCLVVFCLYKGIATGR